MKVVKKYKDWEGNKHKAKLKAINTDDLTGTEFLQMCLDLYEKEGWLNPVEITIKGTLGWDKTLKCNPKLK